MRRPSPVRIVYLRDFGASNLSRNGFAKRCSGFVRDGFDPEIRSADRRVRAMFRLRTLRESSASYFLLLKPGSRNTRVESVAAGSPPNRWANPRRSSSASLCRKTVDAPNNLKFVRRGLKHIVWVRHRWILIDRSQLLLDLPRPGRDIDGGFPSRRPWCGRENVL